MIIEAGIATIVVGDIVGHIGINQFPSPIRLGMGVLVFHKHRIRMPRRTSLAAVGVGLFFYGIPIISVLVIHVVMDFIICFVKNLVYSIFVFVMIPLF